MLAGRRLKNVAEERGPCIGVGVMSYYRRAGGKIILVRYGTLETECNNNIAMEVVWFDYRINGLTYVWNYYRPVSQSFFCRTVH